MCIGFINIRNITPAKIILLRRCHEHPVKAGDTLGVITIDLQGAGYTVKAEGKSLVVGVGFAKPASLAIPDGVTVDISSPNARGNDVPAEFIVRSADKCVVGQFAAAIRKVKPPEPYKGKGIRYVDEIIKRKVGKAFASGAG